MGAVPNSQTAVTTGQPRKRGIAGGMLVLLGCQCLGELAKVLTGAVLPGSVIGMLILLTALILRRGVPPWLGEASQRIIGALSLLFLPPSVGLFFLGSGFADQWPAVIGAILLGTLLTMAITALLMQKLLARRGNPPAQTIQTATGDAAPSRGGGTP